MSIKEKIHSCLWFSGTSKDKGENFAAKFLKKNGYRIICRNYDVGFAEIDIIAQKADITAFVEVKQRKSTAYGLPGEAVGREKQRKIRRAAESYIANNSLNGTFRFDVIEIYGACDGSKKPELKHILNAF